MSIDNNNQQSAMSTTFSSAYLRQPVGGCSVQPGQREARQDPVQSGLRQDQLRKLP